MCQKSTVMLLRHVEMTKGMNMIALSKSVTFFPLTGDWSARLWVCRPFLCSKSPKFSHFEVSKTYTTYCWAQRGRVPRSCACLRGDPEHSQLQHRNELCSEGSRCSTFSQASPPGTVLLQPHTNFCGATCSSQAWLAVPELCQGRVICRQRLNRQLSWHFAFMHSEIPRAWLWLYSLCFYRQQMQN